MKTKPQYFQASFEAIDSKEAVSQKAKEAGVGTIIKGYASTKTVDRYNDIVDPEAFRKSIATNYRKNPIILFQHDAHRPIGKATMMSIDGKGLYIEAIIIDEEIEPKIRAGILKTFSIGYIPTKLEFEDADGNMLDPNMEEDRRRIWLDPSIKRVIRELDLVENSIVSVPANPDALFTLQKSLKNFFVKEAAKIYGVNHNPDDMKKSQKENLLEVKDGEEATEEAQEEVETPEVPVETPAEEAETKPENEQTTDEVTPPAPESPAGETDGEGDGSETPTEGEKEEEAKPEEAPVEQTEEEKALEIDVKNITTEQVVLMMTALKTLTEEGAEKDARIKELEEIIAKTPVKKAMIYNEHKQFDDKAPEEPKAENPDDKAGFKAMFIAAAN